MSALRPRVRGTLAVDPAQLSRWLPYILAGPGIGVLGVGIYAFAVDGFATFALAMLTAGGAFMIGGLLGFLFAVPKSLATPQTPPAGADAPDFQSSTNLEQISDWLTKIIVGLGLVELGKLASDTKRLVNFLAPALGGSPRGQTFALACLVYFAATGFLIFYVVTRDFIAPTFAEAEELLEGETEDDKQH